MTTPTPNPKPTPPTDGDEPTDLSAAAVAKRQALRAAKRRPRPVPEDLAGEELDITKRQRRA